MRTYLSTLHKRSDKHKKRFALVTAGSFTLLIFAIWALATFGERESTATTASANQAVAEANPFGPLLRGFQAGFEMIKGAPNNFTNELEVVNVEGNYRGPENNLNTYGQ